MQLSLGLCPGSIVWISDYQHTLLIPSNKESLYMKHPVGEDFDKDGEILVPLTQEKENLSTGMK